MIATAPSMPSSLVNRHFPDSGQGDRLRVDTDGECLIIRNVLLDDSKRYDVRIWRYDANKNVILIKDQEAFLGFTIETVRDLVKDMFSQGRVQSPLGTRVWFSNLDNQALCQQEDLALPQEAAGKYSDINETDPVASAAAQIHHFLFNTVVTGWTSSQGEPLHIYPNRVPKEDLTLPKKDTVEINLTKPEGKRKRKAKKKKPLKIPEHVKAQDILPPVLNDASTNTNEENSSAGDAPSVVDQADSSPAETPTQNQQFNNVAEALDAASQSFQTNGFLKDISYSDLQNYSLWPDSSKTDLKRGYDAFSSVLRSPNDTDTTDRSEMKQWLRHHYLAAHELHKSMKNIFEKDDDFENFDEWCKHYAARAVAGFIQVKDVSIENLVNYLKGLDISSPAPVDSSVPQLPPAPVKKSWWPWS